MRKLREALKYAFSDWEKLGITITGSLLFYVLMILLSFPSYSFQLLSSNPLFILEAVTALTGNLLISAGMLGLSLTIVYSLLAGISLTLLYSSTSNSGAGSLTPGLIVSGCASCGTGLLGIIGLGGAVAALPFQGNLVRLGGIGLILFFMNKTGNPEVCDVPVSDE